MDDNVTQPLRVLLVKTRGRSTTTVQERMAGEDAGLAPRGTLFERTLACDVIDEGTIEGIPGLRGKLYTRMPSFVAQALEAQRRAGDYDVVITWSERHTVGVAAVFTVLRVKTPHLALLFWISKPMVRIPLRLFKSGVSRIVTWSSVQRDVAVNKLKFRPGQVVLVRHPVDLEFFHPLGAEPTIIFSAGSTERDYSTLVAAVDGLGLPTKIAASLVVTLNGFRVDTTDVRETLARGGGVDVRTMTSQQLRESYAQARVVVVPLFPSDIDAGVNVILEAMAMGRPVIASRTQGQVDVIRNGENGILVAPQDSAELRAAIDGLLADPDAAEAMGRRAREYVVANHRLEDFIERVRENAQDLAGALKRHSGAARLPDSTSHFVLTRFNVRNFYHSGDPTDEWLAGRLDLFKRYCLPSMAGQTNKNFSWLVLCDSQSPDWFKKEISALGDGIFDVVWVEGSFDAAMASRIVGQKCVTPSVITTRLDNDDAVARDFVDEIQRAFSDQDSEFVNLVNGAQYSGGRLYERPYTQNPFSSLVERCGPAGPATVFAAHHYRIAEHAPVLNISTSHPMWLQVIHDGNVLNEIVGLRTHPKHIIPHFSCSLDVETGAAGIVVDRLFGGSRILWRLVRKPARIRELGRVLISRRSTAGRVGAS